MEYVLLKMEENHIAGPMKSQVGDSELLYGIVGFCGLAFFLF